MMTPSSTLLGCLSILSIVGIANVAAQAPVGSASEEVAFSVFNNSGRNLENTALSDFNNKVVLLVYYTPW